MFILFSPKSYSIRCGHDRKMVGKDFSTDFHFAFICQRPLLIVCKHTNTGGEWAEHLAYCPSLPSLIHSLKKIFFFSLSASQNHQLDVISTLKCLSLCVHVSVHTIRISFSYTFFSTPNENLLDSCKYNTHTHTYKFISVTTNLKYNKKVKCE